MAVVTPTGRRWSGNRRAAAEVASLPHPPSRCVLAPPDGRASDSAGPGAPVRGHHRLESRSRSRPVVAPQPRSVRPRTRQRPSASPTVNGHYAEFSSRARLIGDPRTSATFSRPAPRVPRHGRSERKGAGLTRPRNCSTPSRRPTPAGRVRARLCPPPNTHAFLPPEKAVPRTANGPHHRTSSSRETTPTTA